MLTNAGPVITHEEESNANSSPSLIFPRIKSVTLTFLISEPGELMDVGRTIGFLLVFLNVTRSQKGFCSVYDQRDSAKRTSKLRSDLDRGEK